MEERGYKVLLSSPTVAQPNLVIYSPADDFLYFTELNENSVKKVKPSVGKFHISMSKYFVLILN